MTATTDRVSNPLRTDLAALWIGIAFSVLFTVVIWLAGQRLAGVPHLPDQGASWYYWKLPQATFWSRFTAWAFYLVHQFILWGLVYYGQTRVKTIRPGLTKINFIALGVNAFFIILHLVQTQLWYDGLAQDVSIWSSQGSVVVMLVLILLMENARRGLFFGRKMPISKRIIRVVRDYHGYVFAWATVYTLWYHPMEATTGHLAGFLYMFLLLLQASLAYTRVHVNRWWTVLMETAVTFHGTIVALMTNTLWPMFFFGFAGIFVITQMHGLGLSRPVRSAVAAVYVIAALVVYSQRGWIQLNEIIRIPIIEYVLVFVFAALIAAGLWVADRITQSRSAGARGVAS
jgi:hypothetical protein